MALVATYSAISGLWGVVITDAFQFLLAMGGTIILAIVVVSSPSIGGISGLQQKLPNFVFNFFPNVSNVKSAGGAFALTVAAFLAYVGIQWWASWYPGAEPGGGGYVAQRMMSAKDEKHSLFATLFFQIAHYCLRPWPWILVGLSTLVLYPHLGPDAKRMGYIYHEGLFTCRFERASCCSLFCCLYELNRNTT
jgi:Na+/proline symporter